MIEQRDNIIELLKANPLIYHVALELSLRSKDEKLSVVERMHALAELSNLLSPLMLESAKRTFASTTDDKPKYTWRNGARVKVQ